MGGNRKWVKSSSLITRNLKVFSEVDKPRKKKSRNRSINSLFQTLEELKIERLKRSFLWRMELWGDERWGETVTVQHLGLPNTSITLTKMKNTEKGNKIIVFV